MSPGEPTRRGKLEAVVGGTRTPSVVVMAVMVAVIALARRVRVFMTRGVRVIATRGLGWRCMAVSTCASAAVNLEPTHRVYKVLA